MNRTFAKEIRTCRDECLITIIFFGQRSFEKLNLAKGNIMLEETILQVSRMCISTIQWLTRL